MKKIDSVYAVILSGGKSSHMGVDKSFLAFANEDSLVEYQYKKLLRIFQDVYISSKVDKFNFLESKDKVILDDLDTYSPMVALDTILNKIKHDKVFIICVDIPLVYLQTINELIDTALQGDFDIVVAKDTRGNRHPLCSVFDKSSRRKIQNCLKNNIHKINYLIDTCNYKECIFKDDVQFININTPQEYDVVTQITNYKG